MLFEAGDLGCRMERKESTFSTARGRLGTGQMIVLSWRRTNITVPCGGSLSCDDRVRQGYLVTLTKLVLTPLIN